MAMQTTASFDRPISTSACLIIGDEILNGRTVDTNSGYFSRYCFDLGINLKRIEVVADEEGEIIEAVRRMSRDYDFVVTSGGIGPTHDDITYPSIAEAFGLRLALHEETMARMERFAEPSKLPSGFDWNTPSPALIAKQRMAMLPTGASVKNVYISPDSWVPVCIVNYNVYILPGIPNVFELALEGLRPLLIARTGRKPARVLISTPLTESEVAEYLTVLQERVKEKGVKVGSYPRWGKSRNTVTLVGIDQEYLEGLVGEVEKAVGGRRVAVEGEDDE